MFFTGSHQIFSDVNSLLACASQECVFCQQKELANKDHLSKKHLRDAIYFLENNQGMEYNWTIERCMMWFFFFNFNIVMHCIRSSTFFPEKFVVACFCKDSKQLFRSHYHCPFCKFRILTRSGIFIKHLKSTHGKCSVAASTNILICVTNISRHTAMTNTNIINVVLS